MILKQWIFYTTFLKPISVSNDKRRYGRRTRTSTTEAKKKPHPFDGHTLMWIAWAFFVYCIFIDLNQTKSILIPYSQFEQEIAEKKVESVTFKLDEIHGKYLGTDAGKTNSFKTIIPAIPDADLLPLLENNKITAVALSQADPKWLQVLLGVLPWLLIMAFFIYSSRMLQNRMGAVEVVFLVFLNRTLACSKDLTTNSATMMSLESKAQSKTYRKLSIF